MSKTQATTPFCAWLDGLRITTVYSVYKMYDETGKLLYVGMSEDVRRRLREHRKEKPWIENVVAVEVTPYLDKNTALEAEAKAIQEDGPLFNTAHRQRFMLERTTQFGLALLFEALDDIHRHIGLLRD
jgi:predicted GIY-YIG superfamily endonuclease